ncbi:MAG: serine hydrolase [Sarcina sp.]
MRKKFLITTTCFVLIGTFVSPVTSKSRENWEKVEKQLTELDKEEQEKIKAEEAKKETSLEEEKIERIVLEEARDYKDNIDFYYYNFDTKVEYALNEDREFRAASTIKLPQVMLIMDDIHKGKLSFDTTMYYNKKTDYEGGTGSLQYRKKLGKVSVGEAVKLSITTSDNIAYKMLKRNASMRVRDYVTNITGIQTVGTNHLTAKQGMLILKRLYENPDNNPHYEKLIGYLKQTVFHDSFDKYLPHNEVAHKIGSYYRYYHDIGIVYGGTDYIMVMYTKDVGELPKGANLERDNILLTDAGATALELQAKISERIYNFHKDIEKSEKVENKDIKELEKTQESK